MSDDETGEQNEQADELVEARGYDFKNLTAWQVAMELVARVYSLTEGFPRREQYGLAAQMQRAAVSVPSNIAEGHARETKPEYLRGLVLACGSLAELETQLLIAVRVGYLPADAPIFATLKRCYRLPHGLMGSLRRC